MATKSDAVLPLAKAADLTSLRLSHRCVLLVGCFRERKSLPRHRAGLILVDLSVVAYVYGLDYTLRATYQVWHSGRWRAQNAAGLTSFALEVNRSSVRSLGGSTASRSLD